MEANEKTGKIHYDKVKTNTKLFSILVIQTLTYLASMEPDIRENPETKNTYRPPAKDASPKNKYSEIQKWDVGVRYGKLANIR